MSLIGERRPAVARCHYCPRNGEGGVGGTTVDGAVSTVTSPSGRQQSRPYTTADTATAVAAAAGCESRSEYDEKIPLTAVLRRLCYTILLYCIILYYIIFKSTSFNRFPPQVDGPSHFIAAAGGGRRPCGATALKRRLLARAGWRVVPVPHWEWEACAAPPQRRDCLRRLLQADRA